MKLSIITINYNNCDGLRKTIESVVNQTCKEFQYIIIDGGSTDGGVEVIKEYANQIDYWVSESDRGIYHAMNKGIDKAEGEYCIFMNSGDCFYDDTVIGNILPYLTKVDIILGKTKLSNGDVWQHRIHMNMSDLYIQHPCHQSCIIKTDLLRKYHYDEKLKIVADWKFFLQTLILDNCSYEGIDEYIALFDLSGFGSANIALFNEERENVFKELLPDRIVADYHCNYDGIENALYNGIRKSRMHKTMYTINVLILRAMSFFKKGESWTDSFPLQLK